VIQELVSLGVATGATAMLLSILRRVGPHVGLVDSPAGHRHHEGEVPLVGGLAMFCGFVFAVLLVPVPLTPYRSFFAATALLVIVGVLDDLHELSARARFAAQIAASLLMIYWGGIRLDDLGALVSADLLMLGVSAVPLTVFSTVGVINAMNMSDGLDGLAGGFALVALLAMAVMTVGHSDPATTWILVLMCGVVASFLIFNVRFTGDRKALLFMGDAGSMLLGFVLTWFFVSLSQGANRAFPPVAALYFVALPLMDTVGIMLRRILQGKSPFVADRHHTHHLLLAMGLGPKAVLGMLIGMAVALAVAGGAASALGVPEYELFYAFCVLFAVYFVGMTVAWRILPGRVHRSVV